MGKSSDNEYIFHVHIVNSVKGGSGKSTLSLLLANYFSRQNLDAYVIDLDMCGTSWYSDYEKCWNNPVFINDIMYSPHQDGFRENVWSKLKVKDNDGERILNVCLAAKDQNDEICDMPEVELLENTSFQLIKDTIISNEIRILQNKRNKQKKQEWHSCFEMGLLCFKCQVVLSEMMKKSTYKPEILRQFINKISYLNDKNLEKYSEIQQNKFNEEPTISTQLLKQLVHKTINIINIFVRDQYSFKEASNQELNNMITSELEPSKNLEKNFDDCFALISSYFNINILDSIQEDKQLIKKINKMKDAIAVISNYINSIPIHFILDLPPSHEAAVEQICHHLLFDNNSPLNVEYSDKFKVSLYMMTPIDQQSALEKNKAYLKNLMYNKRRYSSKIDDFIRNKHLKNCFVFIDNHNIINTNNINQPTDTDMSNVMGKYLPKDHYSCAFIPFMKLNKEASRIFHRNTLASSIDLSSVEHNSMANLVEKTK